MAVGEAVAWAVVIWVGAVVIWAGAAATAEVATAVFKRAEAAWVAVAVAAAGGAGTVVEPTWGAAVAADAEPLVLWRSHQAPEQAHTALGHSPASQI